MNFNDIFSGDVEPLNEVHYADLLPKSFDDFRKRYTALQKKHQASNLYVQFTSKDNAMDRTAIQNPDHSDFIGTYGYPIAYILSHPADVWYGRGARNLRVLQSTAKRTLDLTEIQSENTITHLLGRCGFDHRTAQQMMFLAKKHYKDRVSGPNKMGKLFLQTIQVDLQSTPTVDDSWGKKRLRYRIRSGQEQTALLLKAGFDAVEDSSRTNKQAVINSREPEQICFLTRGAFRVIEVVALRPGVTDRKLAGMTHVSPDAPVTERPFVAALAAMMSDRIKEGPERSSLNGWSYYWTQKGRRIEVVFNPYEGYYDNKSMGEKKHRQDKLNDPNETAVVIRTELGEMSGNYTRATRFKDIIADLKAEWGGLVTAPEQTEWKPQDRAGFFKQREDERRARIQAKLDKEKKLRESAVPRFLKDVQWMAKHYGLPFIPAQPAEDNEQLIEMCDSVSNLIQRRSKTVTEACAFLREDLAGTKYEHLTIPWDEITKIMEEAWDEMSEHESFWWVKAGGSDMFQSMRKILKGWRPGQPVPGYAPVGDDEDVAA